MTKARPTPPSGVARPLSTSAAAAAAQAGTGPTNSSGLPISLITIVAVGILLFLTGWLAPVVAPVGLGVFITALAAPLFGRLLGGGRRPAVAITITVGLMVLIGGGILLLAVVSIRSLTESLGAYDAQLQARYPDATEQLAALGIAGVGDLVSPEQLVAILRTTIKIVVEVGADLVVAIVIAALLLLDGPRLMRIASRGPRESGAFAQARELGHAAMTYLNVRIRVNFVTAGGLLGLMLLVGVDQPLLWAVGTFFLSFVPYLGLIVALVPPTILAFAESGPLAAAVIVIGGTILNVVAENILEPSLSAKALSLATWLVFAMFFLWTWLIGPVGAVLSMPLTVMTVLLLRSTPRTSWIAALMTRE